MTIPALVRGEEAFEGWFFRQLRLLRLEIEILERIVAEEVEAVKEMVVSLLDGVFVTVYKQVSKFVVHVRFIWVDFEWHTVLLPRGFLPVNLRQPLELTQLFESTNPLPRIVIH